MWFAVRAGTRCRPSGEIPEASSLRVFEPRMVQAPEYGGLLQSHPSPSPPAELMSLVEDAARQVAPYHGGAQWQAPAGLFAVHWNRDLLKHERRKKRRVTRQKPSKPQAVKLVCLNSELPPWALRTARHLLTRDRIEFRA